MSESSCAGVEDSSYPEEKYTEKEWCEGASRLFSNVFTIYEPWHKQFIEGNYNQEICSYAYDSLEIQVIQDCGNSSFVVNSKNACINNQKTKLEGILKTQLSQDLATFFDYPLEESPPTKCPYCDKTLHLIKHQNYDNGEHPMRGNIEYCFNCRYWHFQHLEGRYVGRWPVNACLYMSLVSKVREFEKGFPSECSVELAQWIKRNSSRWHTVNPYKLEQLVADIFKANYRHSEVIHVGRPDDGGVDVLFIDTNQQQWLIQVKRRGKPNSSEPVETIRNLLGTMLLEGVCCGIVVSTADHFTHRAYQAVNRAAKAGMTLRLIDRGVLNRMLEMALPDVLPWLVRLMNYYVELPAESLKKNLEFDYQQLTLW